MPPPPPSIPIPVIPAIPPIPALPKRAEPSPESSAATHDLGDVDQATISRVPIEITDNASPTNVSYDMPTGADVAADDPHASSDAAGDARGASTGAAAHLRTTVPFTVPDTQPTPEPLASLDSGPRIAPDPDGEAVTIPARSRNREPAPTAPPHRDRAVPKLPISTAPESLPPPKDNKQQASGPSPACPQCESPMAWVEEHLRFYCKSCRMYF